MITNRRRALQMAAAGLLAGMGVTTRGFAQNIPGPNVSYTQRERLAAPAIRARLQALRAYLKAQNLNFGVGYTTALDRPLSLLAAARAPKDIAAQATRQAQISSQLLALDKQALLEFSKIHPEIVLPELKLNANPTASFFDWRIDHDVTPVRDQHCGDCWAFGAIGAYEGNYLVRHPYVSAASLDTSEQYMVNCATYDNGQKAGSCGGGWHVGVFEYLVSHGTTTEALCPETGHDEPCNPSIKPTYRAVAWGYVTPDVQSGFEDLRLPTPYEMKKALCEHGPITVAVLVTEAFEAYTGEGGTPVFKESLPDKTLYSTDTGTGKKYHNINHDVTLIGWDDSKGAWLIKNSWGTGWGNTCGVGKDKGYMWIAYGSNNIGYGAAWIRSTPAFYFLPPKYYQLMPRVLPFPPPEKLDPEKIRQINNRVISSAAQP